ncbi:MAG: sensor domain-containing diguanylate cyclase [Gemmatimonadetes bacterium]|nr:sensor domain-containing diguanylate cyclase [Gemmatimonadota bacterium]
MSPERGRAVLVLAWLGILVLLLITGTSASPLLALIALGIVLTTMVAGRAVAIGAGAAIALALLAARARTTDVGVADFVAIAGTLLAGAVPAWLLSRRGWRRLESGERVGRTRNETGARARVDESPATRQLPDLEKALQEGCARAHALRAVLWEVDGESGLATQHAASDRALLDEPTLLAGTPLGWVWEEGVIMEIERAGWLAPGRVVRAIRLRRDNGHGTILTLEFLGSDAQPDPGPWVDAAAHVERVMRLADARAAAIAEQRRSALLISTLQRLPSRIDPDEVARELVSAALEMVAGSGGALAVWADDEGEVIAVEGSDAGPGVGVRFGPATSEFALAARGATLIEREYGPGGPALPIVAPDERWRKRPRCLAAIPLVSGERTVAVLGVWSASRPQLDPVAVSLLRTLAPFAALHLEHALEYGRVRMRAETDSLTGLPNRRAFEQALHAEAARHERYGRSLGLILLDVDHFKQINDRWGHEAGDHVLRSVADLLRRELRDIDTAARIGGEEFVILLPETTITAVREAADRLRASVEEAATLWRGESIPVRASIGVSACPACVTAPAGLLSSADAALYEAKRGGRNRVVSAPVRG